MKNLLTFSEFLNESVINEANYLDVWPQMPYGDWKSEYEIPYSVQKDLYSELQSKLGSKTVKVKEDIEDPAKSPIFKALLAMREYDAFWSWTNRSESTTVGAFELPDGEIVVACYQTFSLSDARDTQLWTITK
jgi:hypothetical protein